MDELTSEIDVCDQFWLDFKQSLGRMLGSFAVKDVEAV